MLCVSHYHDATLVHEVDFCSPGVSTKEFLVVYWFKHVVLSLQWLLCAVVQVWFLPWELVHAMSIERERERERGRDRQTERKKERKGGREGRKKKRKKSLSIFWSVLYIHCKTKSMIFH